MAISGTALIEWIHETADAVGLNPDVIQIGIDDGGLTLTSVENENAYLEVGGIPEEAVEEEMRIRNEDYLENRGDQIRHGDGR